MQRSVFVVLLLALAVGGCTRPHDAGDDAAPRRLRVFANGTEVNDTGRLAPNSEVLIQNEHVALFLPGAVDQRAGAHAVLRAAGRWWPMTSAYYGDYTYLGSSVVRPPTDLRVVRLDDEWVQIRLEFAKHRIQADYAGGEPENHPFTKTLWLRSGDQGYYAFVEPSTLPAKLVGTEHELGFGGMWGPGTMETLSGVRVRFEHLKKTLHIKRLQSAVRFVRKEEGLARTLIPLPPTPVLVPVFSRDRFGSVWIYEDGSRPFGAYLHAAPATQAPPLNDLCETARRLAPPQLTRRVQKKSCD